MKITQVYSSDPQIANVPAKIMQSRKIAAFHITVLYNLRPRHLYGFIVNGFKLIIAKSV